MVVPPNIDGLNQEPYVYLPDLIDILKNATQQSSLNFFDLEQPKIHLLGIFTYLHINVNLANLILCLLFMIKYHFSLLLSI